MLKKTLHTAVAAIAVSTMCLPTAEAKEDLILEAESAKWYTVATESFKPVQSGEIQRTRYSSGTVNFQGKVLETHWSSRVSLEWMPGTHILCEAGTTEYAAVEATVLFRGSNPNNTLTMDTVSKEESNDPTNESATVVCFNGQARLHHLSSLDLYGLRGDRQMELRLYHRGWLLWERGLRRDLHPKRTPVPRRPLVRPGGRAKSGSNHYP